MLKEIFLPIWMLLICKFLCCKHARAKMIFFSADRAAQCRCDMLNFNYHSFETGQDCTTINWIHVGRTCTPVFFSLQAFKLEAVTSRHLTSPHPHEYLNFTSLNSSSKSFSFPIEAFAVTDEELYFRVVALNAEAAVCNPNGLHQFYSFESVLLRNGILDQMGVRTLLCIRQCRVLNQGVGEASPHKNYCNNY